jgi:hypothetical protein
MGSQQLVQSLWTAIEAQQFDQALGYLTNDFQFSGPVPVPQSAQAWLGLQAALAKAMPNLTINYQSGSASDNAVTGSVQLIGTHTGEFSVPVPGIPTIPATGRVITLPREAFTATVRDGKVAALHIDAQPDGGMASILAQMGLALPHA